MLLLYGIKLVLLAFFLTKMEILTAGDVCIMKHYFVCKLVYIHV